MEEVKVLEVVGALIWRDGKFLICKRPPNKPRGLLWEFVGGKVERGESKEQAIVRECREELAIEIKPQAIFTEVTHNYPDTTVRLTLFNAEIVQGEPKLLEHVDMQWITPSQAKDYEFCPADTAIINKLSQT